MREFKINEFLSLKLEDGRTNIYVKGRLFRQCKYLLLNISVSKISSFDEIDSIDEASAELGYFLDRREPETPHIPPETEFWGHCSNLQVWYEYEYDTRLLRSSLAFPLLKQLKDTGDPLAEKAFREEVIKRIKSGYEPVIDFLIHEGHIKYLDINDTLREYACTIVEKLHNLDEQDNDEVIEIDYYYDTLEYLFDYHLESQDLLNIFFKFYNTEYFYLLEPYLNRLWTEDQIKLIDKTGDPKIFDKIVETYYEDMDTDADYVLAIIPELINRLDLFPENKREGRLKDLLDVVDQVDSYVLNEEDYELFQELFPAFLKGSEKLPSNNDQIKFCGMLVSKIEITDEMNKYLPLIEAKFESLHNELNDLTYSSFTEMMRAVKGTDLLLDKFTEFLDKIDILPGDENKEKGYTFLVDMIKAEGLLPVFFPDFLNGLNKLPERNKYKSLRYFLNTIQDTGIIKDNFALILEHIDKLPDEDKFYVYRDLVKIIKRTELWKENFLILLKKFKELPVKNKYNSFYFLYGVVDGTPMLQEFSSQINDMFISLLDTFKVLPDTDNRHWYQIKEFTTLIEKIKETGLIKTHAELIGTKFELVLSMIEKLQLEKDSYWKRIKAFSTLIEQIKETELMKIYSPSIEILFLSLFNSLDQIASIYGSKWAGFSLLVNVIKGTRIFNNHSNLIEAKFIENLDDLELSSLDFINRPTPIVRYETYNVNLKTEGNIKHFATLIQVIKGTELVNKHQSVIKPYLVFILNGLDTYPLYERTDLIFLLFEAIKGTAILADDEIYPLITLKILMLLNEHERVSESERHDNFLRWFRTIKGTKVMKIIIPFIEPKFLSLLSSETYFSPHYKKESQTFLVRLVHAVKGTKLMMKYYWRFRFKYHFLKTKGWETPQSFKELAWLF